jgi:hypothetical protein
VKNPIRRVQGYAKSLRNLEKRSAYDALADLCERYEGLAATNSLARYERKVFSQNGEDGVIAEVFARIGVTDRRFVEFGAGDGTENNCAFLADVMGWTGIFAEADEARAAALAHKYQYSDGIETRRQLLTPESVDALVSDGKGPSDELDILSIDVDSIDYHLWKNVVSVRPRVVIIEYNPTLPGGARVTLPLGATPELGEYYFGASLSALIALGQEKGYAFVYCELSGTNAFFVRDDLVDLLGSPEPVLRSFNRHLQGAAGAHAPTHRQWDVV